MEIGWLVLDPFQKSGDFRMTSQYAWRVELSRQFSIGKIGVDRPVANGMNGNSVSALATFRNRMVPLHTLAKEAIA